MMLLDCPMFTDLEVGACFAPQEIYNSLHYSNLYRNATTTTWTSHTSCCLSSTQVMLTFVRYDRHLININIINIPYIVLDLGLGLAFYRLIPDPTPKYFIYFLYVGKLNYFSTEPRGSEKHPLISCIIIYFRIYTMLESHEAVVQKNGFACKTNIFQVISIGMVLWTAVATNVLVPFMQQEYMLAWLVVSFQFN